MSLPDMISPLICLLLGIVTYFYFHIRKKQNYWQKKDVNCIKPTFVLGSIAVLTKNLPQIIQDVYNAFPEERYHGFYELTSPALLIKDPDLIKQITVKHFDHFINRRSFISSKTDPFWSRNLLDLKNERWREIRSTVTHSFSSSKLKNLYGLMEERALQFVDYFQRLNQEVVEVEMKECLRRYSCDVIAAASLGLECDSLKSKDDELYALAKNVIEFNLLRLIGILLNVVAPTVAEMFQLRIVPSQTATGFSKIIENIVKNRKETNTNRPDLIHLLLQAQKRIKPQITDQEMSAASLNFIVAGFAMTGGLLTFTLYELALNPEIQDKLRHEIPEKITYDNIQSFAYLDMIICEVLRMYPPLPVADRQVTKDFTIQPVRPEEKPFLLEKGVIVWIPILALHRDPRFFPDPEKFDPERFSDENRHKINPGVYLPFGAGPRGCFGTRFSILESKLFLVHVLKNFRVVKIDRTQDVVVYEKYKLLLSAEGGVWLGLKRI